MKVSEHSTNQAIYFDISSILDHSGRVEIMHKANQISITKSTHAGRCFAAFFMRRQGASVEDAKSIGLWSSGGSFSAAYD